jgi:hypothetical protein
MENEPFISKYFTPTLEDIKVGYKCEILSTNGKVWLATTINEWCPGCKMEDLIVPYLTKEQIRDNGWQVIVSDAMEKYRPGRFAFQKGNYFLVVDFNKQIPFLDIILRDPSREERVPNPERFRFFCSCKDINTLHDLEKLLNIN